MAGQTLRTLMAAIASACNLHLRFAHLDVQIGQNANNQSNTADNEHGLF